MGKLDGKVAFITGAARNMGRGHALRMAEEGADIIALDICDQIDTVPYKMSTEADLDETVRLVEATGRRIYARKGDVRDIGQVREVVDAGVSELGHLDIVVANAGIWSISPAIDMEPQKWQDVIDVCVTGVWNTAQASLRHLIDNGGGSMVLISSVAGLRGSPNIGHYNTAKTGVIGIMRSLANELAPKGIRVNAVCPTVVPTDLVIHDDFLRLFRPDLDSPTLEDVMPILDSMHPLPGMAWAEIEDITKAALFLASDDARYITCVALPVDSGISGG